MNLKFPGLGGVVASGRSQSTAIGRLRPTQWITGFLLLPILLLVLGTGCHHSSNLNASGTPPTIAGQPSDVTTVSGRLASFTVGANGAPVLAYQWTKDGVDIFGAMNSTFTIYDPQPADSGHYSVIVSNDYGSLTSYAAALTVAYTPQFTAAVGIAYDQTGNLFVSDRDDQVIWKVSPSKQLSLFAGTQGIPGSSDGLGSGASFRNPGCLAYDSTTGTLVVADTGNHTIRRIAADGTVTTVAGSPGVTGTADGGGTLARFNGPYGLAVNASGGVYIADSLNHSIRFMAPDGTISTFAGTPQSSGQSNGNALSAQFDQPSGLALASDGTLYVADYGNSCIRKISPNPNAQVGTLAGQAGTVGYSDATGTAALFRQPVGITLDPATGNLWVADTYNHAIRRVTPTGVVTVMAGSGTAGNTDGSGISALFSFPCGITTRSGNFLVADTYNHILRVVTPAGVVTAL